MNKKVTWEQDVICNIAEAVLEHLHDEMRKAGLHYTPEAG